VATFTISGNGAVGQAAQTAGYPYFAFNPAANTNVQFTSTYTAGAGCSVAPVVQVYPSVERR
jgi:hypothetical protein